VQGNLHAPFGKRTTEQDLHHRHLAGAPLHSEGAGAQQCAPATRRFRIQRKRKQGTNKDYVYTFIGQRPIRSVKAKIRALTHRTSQQELGFSRAVTGWSDPSPGASDAPRPAPTASIINAHFQRSVYAE
jgi:hypothetical protein